MKRRTFIKIVGGAGVGMAMGGCATTAGFEQTTEAHPSGLPRRRLGRTGFKVSVVGYSGLALIHGTQEEGTASIHAAFDRGLNYYDVAPAYGKGECEIKMGVGLQGLDRSRYFLACKTKMRDAAGAREELERSLERLKTDHFDVYQLHHLVKPADVEQALGPGGAMETVLKAKQEGKIRAIGFSAHTTKAALLALKGFKFDTCMFPVNYVEYYTRDYGREVLELARHRGAAVLSIKTMNAGAWPKDVKRTRQWWYRSLEEQDDINLAWRWTLSLPGVVTGFPPSWLDLQARAIEAGRALRPATAEDAEKLRKMAGGCGSIFKREEDSVALGTTPKPFYPDHPHDFCPGSWA